MTLLAAILRSGWVVLSSRRNQFKIICCLNLENLSFNFKEDEERRGQIYKT